MYGECKSAALKGRSVKVRFYSFTLFGFTHGSDSRPPETPDSPAPPETSNVYPPIPLWSEKQLAEMWSGAPISDRESFIPKL
jgi:hypothetical protein